MVSKAQAKATAKYNAKRYDQITTRLDKGKKQIYVDYATAHGMSFASLVQTAIDKYIEENK